jgi:hypothetical protein
VRSCVKDSRELDCPLLLATLSIHIMGKGNKLKKKEGPEQWKIKIKIIMNE